MTARDWSRARSRDRVARQGAEALSRPRAGARKEAEAARMITRALRCTCGHRGIVERPSQDLVGRKFKCSMCGKVMK